MVVNAPAALQAMGANGYYEAIRRIAEIRQEKEDKDAIEEIFKENCHFDKFNHAPGQVFIFFIIQVNISYCLGVVNLIIYDIRVFRKAFDHGVADK